MEKVDQKVLNKIHDLLKLASGSSGPESEASYKAAQAILTKHRLTMAEFEAKGGGVRSKIMTGKPLFEGTNVPTWQSVLAEGLSNLNGCKCWIERKEKTTIQVIGHEDDIEIVHYMFDSIVTQTTFLVVQAKSRGLGAGKGKGWMNDFRRGIITKVLENLRTANEETRAEYSGSNAIVLVDQRAKDVEAALLASVGKLRKTSVTTSIGIEGFSHGRREGDKVHLSKGLKGGGSVPVLPGK